MELGKDRTSLDDSDLKLELGILQVAVSNIGI
jgi:hypothetical protein